MSKGVHRTSCCGEKDYPAQEKIDDLNNELAEWRTGKRRVYWRLRWVWANGASYQTEVARLRRARQFMKIDRTNATLTLYRVTVRPKEGT